MSATRPDETSGDSWRRLTRSSEDPSDPDRTSKRWREIQEATRAALDLPAGERPGFLNRACAGDPELRGEVESLLAAHASPSLLDEPAAELIAPLVAELSPESLPIIPGGMATRFEVLEKLGSGGMGIVYKARDSRLGRLVALKFLSPHLSSDERATQRFVVEAQATATLDHPNICALHEIGETDDGRIFLVMSFCDGETLKQRIARRPFTIKEALAIAVQIARGLGKAHERGIVHRDVKPANVIVAPDGTVKIVDFGIAKLADVSVTGPGSTPGTVAYMSPEQAGGGAVDHRTDLWALGVVLYEMITEERPFRGDHEQVVLHAILHSEPQPVAAFRADVPPAVSRVLSRLLAKRPAERHATTEDLVSDLEGIIRSGNGAPGDETYVPNAGSKSRPDGSRSIRGLRRVLPVGTSVFLRNRVVVLLGCAVLIAGVGFGVALHDAASPTEETPAAGGPSIARAPNGNPVARDLVRRAMELIGRGQSENQTAIDLLWQAIRLDAGLAEAYASLSGAYLQRVQLYGFPKAGADSGVALARTALRLNPELPRAHLALGLNLVELGRLTQAGAAYKRALELDSTYAQAMSNLGTLARKRGRHDDAVRWFLRAHETQSTSSSAAVGLGTMYWFLGSWPEAERWLTRGEELGYSNSLPASVRILEEAYVGSPHTALAQAEVVLSARFEPWMAYTAGYVASLAGDWEAARRHLERLHESAANWTPFLMFPSTRTRLATVLLRTGDAGRAASLLNEAFPVVRKELQAGNEGFAILLDMAMVHAMRGEKVAALDWLERAFAAGARDYRGLRLDPALEQLRGDERFQSIVGRMEAEVQRMRREVQNATTAASRSR